MVFEERRDEIAATQVFPKVFGQDQYLEHFRVKRKNWERHFKTMHEEITKSHNKEKLINALNEEIVHQLQKIHVELLKITRGEYELREMSEKFGQQLGIFFALLEYGLVSKYLRTTTVPEITHQTYLISLVLKGLGDMGIVKKRIDRIKKENKNIFPEFQKEMFTKIARQF